MDRYYDHLELQDRARALRHEALAGIARGAAIKWKALLARLSHAPLPRQGPAPTHP